MHLKRLSFIFCSSLKIRRQSQIIPSMTSAEPSFITKSCQHHYFDRPVTQKQSGSGNWPLNTDCGSGRVWGWVCSGLHFIPKPFHFSCPNKPRAVIAVWEHCIEHVTTYFQKYTVGVRRKPCLGASHLWKKKKNMAVLVNHCDELPQMPPVNLL